MKPIAIYFTGCGERKGDIDAFLDSLVFGDRDYCGDSWVLDNRRTGSLDR